LHFLSIQSALKSTLLGLHQRLRSGHLNRLHYLARLQLCVHPGGIVYVNWDVIDRCLLESSGRDSDFVRPRLEMESPMEPGRVNFLRPS
jgi:hypothetical protein